MSTETAAKSPAKSEKRKNAWKNLPDVWALMKPRRGLLALGFVLMAINRVSGLVLPGSMKYFVDKRRAPQTGTAIDADRPRRSRCDARAGPHFLQPDATTFQISTKDDHGSPPAGAGAYRAASHSVLRRKQDGVLVSRIMSDVEGIRNLVGTGLVEFAGGLMTAAIALIYLIHTSVTMTGLAFSILLVFGFGISWAFKTIRPIFRARPKITAEVTDD